MAEYVYNPVQEVEAGQNVLLQDSIPCNRGYVIHRNGSGILTLRGIVNNPCSKFARYKVEFNGNIVSLFFVNSTLNIQFLAKPSVFRESAF